MQPWLRAACGIAAVVTATPALGLSREPALPLRTVTGVALGGNSPRFDYQSIDGTTGRLYIAHQGDGRVLVVDLAGRRVVASVGGLADVHGVLVAPALHRLYATATAQHQLVVIDTRSNRILARHRAGVVPDGIAYDPETAEVYVSDERPAGGVVVAGARSGRVVHTIALGGSAGNVQYDRVGRRILVGVETRDELAVIDPSTHGIARRVPVPGCRANHSLLVDSSRRLLLVGCSANGRLVLLDADDFRVLGHVDGAGHVDVLAIDPSKQRAYSSSEDGVVTVVQLRGHQAPHLIGQAHLAPRAHTIAVDPRTHLVYLPLGRTAGASVLRIMRTTR
jgi:DNA-binding beta-propeller fold protein YncE